MIDGVKNLGILRGAVSRELGGKILVFGGVYSNLQALETLQKVAEKEGISPDNIICTGDIVGYCAQPSECLDAIEKWGIHAIQGNVEENLLSGNDDCGCNFRGGGRCDIFSRQWFPFAASKMTKKNLAYLKTLPQTLDFQYANKHFRVLHGSANHISEFIFKSTDWAIKADNFTKTQADVILAGHCGLPFVDEKDGKIWLNSGVIGMPANDGETSVWYTILNDLNGELTYAFHRLEYDFKTAHALMLENKLPRSYAQTLLNGIWDNTEIMPETEAAQQGKTIHFKSEVSIKTHKIKKMSKEKQYFEPEKDLKQFGKIGEWQPDLAKKFFDYYNASMEEGALSAREKSLIALAVAHALQCPYCIDAYTSESIKQGADEEQMMEAVHVTAAMKAGITLVYSTQMMKHAKEKLM